MRGDKQLTSLTIVNMSATEDILVTIPQGILRGNKEVSPYDDIFYSFQRIPYAKPPVGDLRFKAPVPAEGWTEVRDATKQGAAAPQIDLFAGTGGLVKEADEDCLFVHVYTKEIPKPGKKLPVMVWIHGGGYTYGTGNKDTYSPDYFMTHDVVFVTMNYRLGAFGFLSLQTLECPGNFGLKDQRLALQWVQKNISYFGGDPDNVTIFGESAGATAVHYHLSSPSCKGLFKRAIAQSGAVYNPWAYARHPREYAYLLGKRLGCDAANDEQLLDFLKKAPMEDIIIKSVELIPEIEGERFDEKIMSFSFVPTSEPESEEAFITDNPLSAKFDMDVPYITGATEKEMLMVFFNEKQVPSWKEDKDFQELIPRCLNLEKDSELSLKIAKKIREFYFKDDGINIDGLIDVLSDTWFTYGVHQAVTRRTKNPSIKSPTFLYKLSYRESSPSPVAELMSKIVGFSPEVQGVAHIDDIRYLFVTELFPEPALEKGSPDYDTMRRLVDLWVNFATTGNPTNEKSEVVWKPTSISEESYLDIGTELRMKKGFFKERMEFWDEIFKLAGYEN